MLRLGTIFIFPRINSQIMSPIDQIFCLSGVSLIVRGRTGCFIEGVTPEGNLIVNNHGEKLELSPEDPTIDLQPGIDWEGWLERWPEGQPRSGEAKG